MTNAQKIKKLFKSMNDFDIASDNIRSLLNDLHDYFDDDYINAVWANLESAGNEIYEFNFRYKWMLERLPK